MTVLITIIILMTIVIPTSATNHDNLAYMTDMQVKVVRSGSNVTSRISFILDLYTMNTSFSFSEDDCKIELESLVIRSPSGILYNSTFEFVLNCGSSYETLGIAGSNTFFGTILGSLEVPLDLSAMEIIEINYGVPTSNHTKDQFSIYLDVTVPPFSSGTFIYDTLSSSQQNLLVTRDSPDSLNEYFTEHPVTTDQFVAISQMIDVKISNFQDITILDLQYDVLYNNNGLSTREGTILQSDPPVAINYSGDEFFKYYKKENIVVSVDNWFVLPAGDNIIEFETLMAVNSSHTNLYDGEYTLNPPDFISSDGNIHGLQTTFSVDHGKITIFSPSTLSDVPFPSEIMTYLFVISLLYVRRKKY